jgi:hypothetical protein
MSYYCEQKRLRLVICQTQDVKKTAVPYIIDVVTDKPNALMLFLAIDHQLYM